MTYETKISKKGKKYNVNSANRPFEIDWETVKKLCIIQCTRDEISAFLEVSHDTLLCAAKRDFGCVLVDKLREWRKGGNCSLRRKQWKLCDTSASMAIFLGKNYLKQQSDYNLNHTGSFVQEIVHYGDEPPRTYSQEETSYEEAVNDFCEEIPEQEEEDNPYHSHDVI